jgi:hypothetical protein
MRRPRPLAILEEHHEAFYVWHSGRERGWLPREPQRLLHFDEHADMNLPDLRRPLENPQTLPEVADFTYSELRINTFLCPALYLNLFNSLYWFRITHSPSAGGWRRLCIQPRDAERLRFSLRTLTGLGPGEAGAVEYAPMTTADPLPPGPCVLDIDLDYFCWNDEPEWRNLVVEITRSEYDRFLGNRYHFVRLSPDSEANVFERDGRVYLAFRHMDPTAAPATHQSVVAARIDEFASYLARCGLDPLLITLCRSRHSGYTQSINAGFAEKRVLERLAEAFPYQIHPIQELMAADRELVTC